jgi:hypothetical protein
MIDYQLLVTCVLSRLDLLEQCLASFAEQADQQPESVLVHMDVKSEDQATKEQVQSGLDLLLGHAADNFPNAVIAGIYHQPHIGFGPSLIELFKDVNTDFVFFTQEDARFIRPLPIKHALALVRANNLLQIRFNKRETMSIKGEHRPNRKEWYHKLERRYHAPGFPTQTLCVSDMWYFQAGIWQTAIMKKALDELELDFEAHKWAERKINNDINRWLAPNRNAMHPEVRAAKIPTCIWGPIGEPKFFENLGANRRTMDQEILRIPGGPRIGAPRSECARYFSIQNAQDDSAPRLVTRQTLEALQTALKFTDGPFRDGDQMYGRLDTGAFVFCEENE